MNRYFKFYIIAWAIMLVLFNIIVWAAPSTIGGHSKFAGGFWPGYIFITLAFVGQLICANLALKEEKIEKLFLNMPLVTVSYVGLVLTIVLGLVCMLVPAVPGWAGVIVCAVIVGFTAAGVMQGKATAEIIGEMEDKAPAKTIFIKSLIVDAETLMQYAKTDDVKVMVKEVYEAVRYSDPMSHDALSSVESQITLKFAAFDNAIKADDELTARACANEILILLNDRNKKCKLFK